MSRSGTTMQGPALDMLLLAKGVGKAIGEGLQEKGKHSSAARDNRSLDRHSGIELHIRHARQLVGANFDGRQEIGEACPLLGHGIGRDARHLALDDRSRPLLIGHETYRGRQVRSSPHRYRSAEPSPRARVCRGSERGRARRRRARSLRPGYACEDS